MKRRIADILMDALRGYGISHVYLLSGGGIMYLVDALGRSGIMPVCCHHEQSASIAAQAHAMYANALSCCLVTTGPGGTNALTGCAAAFMDSTPMLFLSGQVKTADFAAPHGVRQYGAQENDIIAMARPVTKYTVLVRQAEDALYELDKAVYLALHGRQGPVWVDIPLDVQSAMVEPQTLRRFDPLAERTESAPSVPADAVEDALARLANAARPCILAGHGVIAAGAQTELRSVVRRLHVPLLTTWRALELLGHDDPLFFGSPGLQAARYANIIVQAADFLLVLGSRLDNMITAFAEERFGLRARKMVVDLDKTELRKLRMPHLTSVHGDAGDFLRRLARKTETAGCQDSFRRPWLDFCRALRSRFPLAAEKQAHPTPLVDLYRLTSAIGSHCNANDAFVISSTSRCNTAGHIALPRREAQRSISSMGMGAMGFALPSVLGAWFASGGKRVICLEGDGSLQLNVQELQTIRYHGINAKIFVFNNEGYAAIATMQDRNFGGFHVGSDAASGVTMPALEGIAAAYGFGYMLIDNDAAVDAGVARALAADGPLICECVGDIRFDEIPKCISHLDNQGKRVSAKLENPYPFLPEEALESLFAQIGCPLQTAEGVS